MKKAIITGAAGFIGRFLVRELLQNNIEVFAVDRAGAAWNSLDGLTVHKLECDLSSISGLPGMIADNDVDCIFHTAWQGVSGTNRKDASDWKIQLQNVNAALNLIEAANSMHIKTFVCSGSIHEFEIMQEMSEGKLPCDPVNMYKAAKTMAHWMGKVKAGEYGIRFFNPMIIGAYGEQDKPSSLINSVIRKILNGESPELSSGEQIYDFVHVSDIAHALYLIAEKGTEGKEYIIGSGNAKPLKDFLTEAGDIVNEMKGGERISLGFGKHKGKAISLPKEAFDTSGLVNDTGFQPQISFNDGIKRTAEWIISEKNG